MSLVVQNLSVGYEEDKLVLDNLDIEFKRNSINLLIGPSGSGKSTLSLTLNGLIPHSISADIMGDIYLFNKSILKMEPSLLSSKIGIVFQDPDTQFATYTVEDELVFGMENLNFPIDKIEKNLKEYINLLKLEEIINRPLNALSGGEKQRVAIASILTLEPEIIIFDEPTSNLDGKTRLFFFDLIKKLRDEFNKTIIIIEHNLDEFISDVDFVAILDSNGKITEKGELREVIKNYIGKDKDTKINLPKVFSILPHDFKGEIPLSRNEVINWIKSGDVSLIEEKVKKKENNTKILEVDSLSYSINKKEILSDLSFEVNKGDFVALLGPNGAGKSTLAQLLVHLIKKYKGDIRFENIPLKKIKKKDLWRDVGLVFQNPEWQFTTYKVEDELLYSIKKFHFPKDVVKEKIDYYLKAFNLEEKRNDNPYLLSQGQKRRLSVASMLIAGQKLLVLDEPTFGQDGDSIDKIMGYINHLNNVEDMSVIMITHDTNLVYKYCNKALVLENGKMIFDGSPEELFKNKEVLDRGRLLKPYWLYIKEGLENGN